MLIPGQDSKIKIEHICGNVGLSMGSDRPRPQYYEINHRYLMSMLRFHAQMEGDKSITEDQFLAFEEIEFGAEQNEDYGKKSGGKI